MIARLTTAVLLLAAACAARAEEGSADQRFLAGLRERGLYHLAEVYCTEKLAAADLDEARRAELVIELSRSLAEQAVGSLPAARPALWQRAAEVTEQFARQHPDDARLLLVKLQAALATLARGELARQEARFAAQPEAVLEEAKTHLRAAVAELRALADEVEAQWRKTGMGGRDRPGLLSADQLSSLRNTTQYELSRALRNQAECYGPDTADRANSLTQAVGLLEPLVRLTATDPLKWKSWIDLIVCQRLLADREGAKRLLDALVEAKPPAAVELRARAEQIRLALPDRLADATAVMAAGREIDGVTSPELDFAWLEACLGAWQAALAAKDDAKAAAWQQRADQVVRTIELEDGPYWQRRAEMLLAGSVRAAPQSGDLPMLVRAAESAYRSGHPDEALARYDDARKLAAAAGNATEAFRLGYVAATIEHQRQRHNEALRRYRELALAMEKQPEAPQAHQLAIYHAAQLAKDDPAGGLDQYADLLAEHLAHWPEQPDADQVRLRLGQLREHQARWEDALAAYRAVSPGAADYAEVVRSTERCVLAWLAARAAAGEAVQREAGDAASQFESIVLGPDRRWPEKFSPAERTAALAAARLWIEYADEFARAETLLGAALKDSDDAPAEWRSAARAMRVWSLAGSGRRAEAAEVLRQISAGSPAQLLDMLDGLARLSATARPEVGRELASLELQAVELLRPQQDKLSPTEMQRLQKIYAQALADAGRTDEALVAFGQLAARYPLDGEVGEAYARLLTDRDDRASREAALGQWREVEQKSPEASPRWFRAKYSIALLHYRLGNSEQAAKIITLLKVLHPDLGGPELKPRFEKLLDDCRAGGATP